MEPLTTDINKLQKIARDAEEGLAEVVRLLAKVVPEDQNRMIDWAVKSQDAVYTNAGAAFRIGKEALENLRGSMMPSRETRERIGGPLAWLRPWGRRS